MSASIDVELEAEHAARALLRQGSVREGLALLRAAISRDPEEEGCARLLEQVLSGQALDGQSPAGQAEDELPLDLAVVDRWIRRGMLVEALALLGGTAMGSDETGREWANLLGELLAPVPVDAEEALVEMHRHLVTGGASVALVLLEERAAREPTLPAWAERRLALMRWMLLDNANAADSTPLHAGDARTPLAAAIQRAMNERSLPGLLEVARGFAAAHPAELDPPALVWAVEEILAELERHAEDVGPRPRTLPMFGHPSACLQLRMGNLAQACAVYRKLLQREPSDGRARHMLDVVESVLRAAEGEPVLQSDPWDGDTQIEPLPEAEAERLSAPPTLELPLELCYFEDEPTEAVADADPSGVVVRAIRTVE